MFLPMITIVPPGGYGTKLLGMSLKYFVIHATFTSLCAIALKTIARGEITMSDFTQSQFTFPVQMSIDVLWRCHEIFWVSLPASTLWKYELICEKQKPEELKSTQGFKYCCGWKWNWLMRWTVRQAKMNLCQDFH